MFMKMFLQQKSLFKHLKHFHRYKYTCKKIADVNESQVGEMIQIKGWIKTNRAMKKVFFADVNDGSTYKILQIVIDKELKKKIPDLNYGTSVIVSGKLNQTPKGQLEIAADEVQIVGVCPTTSEGYPFVPKQKHSPDHIREFLHLRTQNQNFRSVLRMRHAATKAFHRYFDNNGFTLIHTPILSSNLCEGAGELFSVTHSSQQLLKTMQKPNTPLDDAFFDKKVFLTLSGQLHLEATCNGLGAVYNFGPAFRGENSGSTIHMSEFYMIEAEEAFIDGIENITDRIESVIKSVTNELLSNHQEELEEVRGNANKIDWLDKKFVILTFAEAVEILKNNSSKLEAKPPIPGTDFVKEHELFLVKHVGNPVFIINWPKELKPFYMRECKDNPNLVEGVDLLMPMVGELVGGSIRENKISRLEVEMPSDLNWYLDLRKYGDCRTGGFGIGFDRYLQLLLNIPNIKDVIAFPRWPHHCPM